ncbi:hypothetical protein V6Z11_D03G043300 [Gossypium hirsutum]
MPLLYFGSCIRPLAYSRFWGPSAAFNQLLLPAPPATILVQLKLAFNLRIVEWYYRAPELIFGAIEYT